MNITTIKLTLASAAALALSASHGFAESNGKVSVKIPFEFTAGSSTMPAGTYDFSEDRSGVVYISSIDAHRSIVLLTSPDAGGPAREQPSVKFDKLNGQYTLTEVNMMGEPSHHVIHLDEKPAVLGAKLGVTNGAAKGLK